MTSLRSSFSLIARSIFGMCVLGWSLGCAETQQTPAETPESEQLPPPPDSGKAPVATEGSTDPEAAEPPPPEEPPKERVVTGSPCPAYPAKAQEAGVEGEVLVRYKVTKKGLPKDIEALTGPKKLRKACIDSITYASFPPKVEAGEPVSTVHEKTCTFRLPEDYKKKAKARTRARARDKAAAKEKAKEEAESAASTQDEEEHEDPLADEPSNPDDAGNDT